MAKASSNSKPTPQKTQTFPNAQAAYNAAAKRGEKTITFKLPQKKGR